ncbi:hypothetical protein OIU84_028342 [Salix udensis]|uniref:Ribosomal RNA-processing protein 14 N-terminal domain-containing protein n=1 Tax=Salix udensis TaxID=889485 RepID=A0AAD6KCE8_9ROSI|nr:hypothetical protein OIU84_028342 [Salix udensis]
MGKEKRIPASKSGPDVDLKSLIHQSSLFFDKLIELIPAKFYLPTDDKEKPWFHGLSKGAKASAKKEARENIKKARKNRLDPDKSSATTLDLLMQNLEKEKSNSESDGVEVEINPMMSGLENDDQSVTYEELRQRLRRKIEELRGDRNCGSSENAKRRKEKRGMEQQKRKRESGSLKRQKELEEAKKDPEKGGVISKKHSWKAAASRAAGIKVHDDPKLLKQSLKKGDKRHQKECREVEGQD